MKLRYFICSASKQTSSETLREEKEGEEEEKCLINWVKSES